MTSLRCYGNSDLDKIHRTRDFGLWLVRCDLYLKLEGAIIEQSDRASMAFTSLLSPPPVLRKSTCTTKDVYLT